MDDPEPFFQKARLSTLKNWLKIYEPILLEGFRLAHEVETRNTRPLTTYFSRHSQVNLPVRRSQFRIRQRRSQRSPSQPSSRRKLIRPTFSRPISSYFT